jgi:hypothetical protein
MPRNKQATILGEKKVVERRWFYLSWLPEAPVSPSAGAAQSCSGNLEHRLQLNPRDYRSCPIEAVYRRLTNDAQDQHQKAGEELVAGGNACWTDFVAVVNSEYARANRAKADGNPQARADELGDFTRAIALTQAAGSGDDERRLWLAVVERGHWRNLYVAGSPLGDVPGLRVLVNDRKAIGKPAPVGTVLSREQRNEREPIEFIDTRNKPAFERHLASVLDQLLDPPPLPGG